MNIIFIIILCLYLVITYFFAGIPSAYILTKMVLKKDIRTIGSGNVGATNVYRAGGLKLALPVFAFDFLKGFIPTLISVYAFGKIIEISVIVAIVAIIGHILTPYLKFKGGKGAATSFGAFIVIFPIPVLIVVCFFIIVVMITRIVALGTIIAALSLPIVYYILGNVIKFNPIFPFSFIVLALMIVISIFIIFMHRANIIRLIKGREHKI